MLCAAVVAGCAGPEKKLGRGLNNMLEFTRGGELRRSMEQTALWDGTDAAYTTGFIRGFNRSVARTFVGAVEVLTFPVPPYDALYTSTNAIYPDFSVRNSKYPWGGIILPENPVYPANYQPSLLSDSIFDTDTSLGFSGGGCRAALLDDVNGGGCCARWSRPGAHCQLGLQP